MSAQTPLWKQLLGAGVGSLCALTVYAGYLGASEVLGRDLAGAIIESGSSLLAEEEQMYAGAPDDTAGNVPVAGEVKVTTLENVGQQARELLSDTKPTNTTVSASVSTSTKVTKVASDSHLTKSGITEWGWALVALAAAGLVQRRRIQHWYQWAVARA
jgi:MYXO-CTERM domain-containing protein